MKIAALTAKIAAKMAVRYAANFQNFVDFLCN